MTEAEGESLVERRQRPVSVTTDVKALFNGGVSQVGPAFRSLDDSLGFAGPLSYHDPKRVQDVWQPPAPAQSAARAEHEPSKRDSDPVIQEKVRMASHHAPTHNARSVSARTQSLDITSLNFSRALMGGGNAFGPVPPSPGAATSSPNTATGQYFPGQHDVRASVNLTGRPASTYESSSVDSVTQGWFAVHCGALADGQVSPTSV